MYQQYTANHKKWDHVGNLTPNIEISEGIRPAEELIPASYLPLVRFDKYLEDYFVVSAGKVVALDSNGDVVPAGLKLQADTYQAAWDAAGGLLGVNRQAGRDAVALLGTASTYAAIDVAQPNINGPGVNHAGGNPAAAGDLVVEGFFKVQTVANGIVFVADMVLADENDADQDLETPYEVTVSKPIGIAPYNYFRWAGGVHGGNPSGMNFHNYNMQHQLAVLCDYYIELPRVDDKAAIEFDGIAVLFDSGLTILPGDFLTYDINSDMVVGGSDCTDIIGQAWKIDTGFPKDYLERVRTAYQGLGELDKMPGSASAGLPDNI
ncbi:unnamed protein product, partial [marine sediment metagenome]